MKNSTLKTPLHQQGFNLMEILIALVVFAVGMLALAQFQGGLTRTSADANARSVAINAAEEIIEDRRGFSLLAADADPTAPPSYEEIIDSQYTLERGGVALTVTETVEDFYYNASTDSFSTVDETGDKTYSDLKQLTVNVAWGGSGEDTMPAFRIDRDSVLSVEEIGSGEVQVSTVIKSNTSQSSAYVLTQVYDNLTDGYRPYSPGQNPDVISLNLGDNKFKESLTPEPRVITQDELVETTFDVITYSQTGDGALFLRREEFKVISCACGLAAPPAAVADSGYRPTLWAADEYDEGEQVIKATGVSINNQQSQFCDICCADHHDGGTGSQDQADDPGRQRYDPWRTATDYWTTGDIAGDHKHYDRDSRGNLILAQAAGDEYFENCRMVRVDGFWRVAQDLRREGLNIFPFDYLDDSSEVTTYSEYVTGAVQQLEAALTNGYETASPVPTLSEPADGTFPDSTVVPTWTGETTQQLRSRGIYVDFMTRDLREVINCLQSGNSVETCSTLEDNSVQLDRVGSGNVLELIPFSEVQLTWLTRWTESPANEPVDVTNEALETNNTHSRGVASPSTTSSGTATVDASGHRGNIGLTDTDPIDTRFDTHTTAATLSVTALTEAPPPPDFATEISGKILSGVSGVQATKAEITSSDALCNRTPDGYVCWLTGPDPRIVLSNYKKQNTNMAACSETLRTTNQSTTANNPTTTFSFLDSNGIAVGGEASHDIFFAENSCPVGG